MQQKFLIFLVVLALAGVGIYWWTGRSSVGQMVPAGIKSKIDTSKILSGGPGKDGISSIDNPKFWTTSEAEKFLEDGDVVLGLEYEGETRAYPLRIMNWHEIVNDTLRLRSGQDVPILITYCPLCYTGIAFKREINGVLTEFGVSGKLYNNNLLMYNRPNDEIREESLWSQQLGEAVTGSLTGTRLEQIVIDTLAWADWRQKHPGTKVLSTDTGHSRDYDRNPYGDYETNAQIIFPVTNEDNRLPPKAKIYGIELDGKFKVYPQDKLVEGKSFTDNFQGKKIKILVDEVGRVRMEDVENNKEIGWQISYWFSWVAFHPETEVY